MNPNPDEKRRAIELREELTMLVQSVTQTPHGDDARYDRIREILEYLETEKVSKNNDGAN